MEKVPRTGVKNRLLQGLNHILASPQHSIHDSLPIDLLPSCIILYELRNILFKVNRKIQSSVWSIEFSPFSAAKIIFLFHFTTLNGIDDLLFSLLDAQKGCESKYLID